MEHIHEQAKRCLLQAICAALMVRPLDSGLTQAELEKIGIACGFSSIVLSEVLRKWWWDQKNDGHDRVVIDLPGLSSARRKLSRDFFPLSALKKVEQAMKDLTADQGKDQPKTFKQIESRCSDEKPEDVALAVGLAIVMTQLLPKGTGYVKGSYAWNWGQPGFEDSQEWEEPITKLQGIVESVFALRAGEVASTTPPVDRFFNLLRKQGWTALAQWWAMTSREMQEAGDRYPTASTVLAGALLEAALVAIAEPAKAAGEWNHSFVNDDPTTWQLSKHLIKQAEAAKTFSQADAALARNVADMRNRIHAGRFSTGGKTPFAPPSTNAHEANLARLNLDRLLDVILKWEPIAKLA